MRRVGWAALVLFAACGGDRDARPDAQAPGPVTAPEGLAAIVSLPRLEDGLRPLADLAEDLLPLPLVLGDGREAALAVTGLGPEVEDRLDGRRPAFVLLFGPDDPPVFVLPVRAGGAIQAPPEGFARVRGGTALVSESGALLDEAEAYAVRTLARRRPDALTLEILPGPGRALRIRRLETVLVEVARGLEASARRARAAARVPPTLGDPESIGPLLEDLAREALASAANQEELVFRLESVRGGTRLEARTAASGAPPPAASPPPPPALGKALLRWSAVRTKADRASFARGMLNGFARITGTRLPDAERAALRTALVRWERARGEGSSWAVGLEGAAASFRVPAGRADEALEAARDLARLASGGHAGRVLGSVGFLPIVTDRGDGGTISVRFGEAPVTAAAPGPWASGTVASADLHLLRAVAALGPLGDERAQALAAVASRAPEVPPATFSVRRDDGHWEAALLLPRESARELGRALRRGLSH